jgi:hypothetical protein
VRWQTDAPLRRVQSVRMDYFPPRTHSSGVEQRPRSTAMNALSMIRNSGMAVLAMLLAVTLANLVCG